MKRGVPLGREQTPQDIGQLAAFLASDAARNITGQWIAVDGGITLRGPGWCSAPLVGMTLLVGLYASSQLWLPPSLYGLGLIARAYFVYSYGS